MFVDGLYRWAVNTSSGVVDVPLNLSNSRGVKSLLRYTPQTHHDFGDLLCWAINDLGTQLTPCVFKVIPAGTVYDFYTVQNRYISLHEADAFLILV